MATDASTAAELLRAIKIRARGIEVTARNLRGSISQSRKDLRRGLDLFEAFGRETGKAADEEFARTSPHADAQASVLLPLLQRLTVAGTLLERHFTHGERREHSEFLSREIRTVLVELGLDRYDVVTSHGDADNFITSHGSLESTLFGPLIPVVGPQPFLTGRHHALFRLPRLEGWGLMWRPWLLGHEVAHLAVVEFDAISTFGLNSKFDYKRAATLPSPLAGGTTTDVQRQKALYEIASNWLTELLCDAFAVLRYGPAAVAAMGEFMTTVSGMNVLSETHPPGTLRLQLAGLHLGPIGNSRVQAIADPWLKSLPSSTALTEAWADELQRLFLNHQADIKRVVEAWPASSYHWQARTDLLLRLADRIKDGIPGEEIVQIDSCAQASVDADLFNAVWVARVEDCELPIDELGRKALDSLEFCRRWVDRGGRLPVVLDRSTTPPASSGESGILSESEILTRLSPNGPHPLVVTPLMQAPRGTALDLRLGNRFIVFRRSSVGYFDPIDLESDPRLMQVYVELDWSERFVLHPNEMVLGATLEYITLPRDLTAQVASRSSYGRLGLLSATAVQVHPYFHGCLTLELVNLSSIPLALSPGERIAQLIMSHTDGVDDPGREKYAFATGPEFSKVHDDEEAAVIRRFREE
jgi:deoxycytidine triphosphate deaminase